MANYKWTVQHKGEFSGWSAESDPATFSTVAPQDRLFVGGSVLDPQTLETVGSIGATEIYGADGYMYTGTNKYDPGTGAKVGDLPGQAMCWGADNYLYCISNNGNDIQKVDPSTLVVDSTVYIDATAWGQYADSAGGEGCWGIDGYVYFLFETDDYTCSIAKIDPTTMTKEAQDRNFYDAYGQVYAKDIFTDPNGFIYTVFIYRYRSHNKYRLCTYKWDSDLSIKATHTTGTSSFDDDAKGSGVLLADGNIAVTMERMSYVRILSPDDLSVVADISLPGSSRGYTLAGPDGYLYAGQYKIDPAAQVVVDTLPTWGELAWTRVAGTEVGINFSWPSS